MLSVSLSGALGTSGGGSIDSSQESTVEALVTNVVGFASQDPNVVLFRAQQQDSNVLAGCGPNETGRWNVGSSLDVGSSTRRKGSCSDQREPNGV